ncbi:hypothetical protein EYB26_003316 [Talaromyces marneffei]|uniref:uncharacterized protein n=1 Tax=Talaromyces marneffei TaxID=37727 RepID=UPI0012A7D40F|nr:uncharacterized protein EYB26_003316 [Talaromyces marneffei]QGA15656.1 hypothetical protein EYB26_003316 [Talaromyces marneffei]
MEVIDTLPPRKRRKTEGDIPKSLFWFGQGTGVTKFGFESTNERNERQYQQPQMTHTDPHSIARLASQQTNLAPIKTPRGSHHKVNLGAKESQIFDPAYNLLQPPRVHVRSSSGFPELNDIHVESISAAALFAKRRRVNSQPTLTSGTGESPQDYAPHQRAGGIWGPSQRPSEDHSSESSSERAPLLSRSRQLALDAAASRSRKHQSVSLSTDDGVNETLQHIGKCKSLWFVVIAILVGVFLILFLYAFHILD